MRLPSILNATATALVACDGGDTALPGPGTSNRSLGGLAIDIRRTVIFMFGQTQPGQDIFIRDGLDHDRAGQLLGRDCTAANYACAMPISHLNLRNATTEPLRRNEAFLDWYGAEA